ncbi:MAG TPA: CGNR zinc finger domain-containing protein [Candidatus Limnocylindrales bacterium]|jgi:predicted RNA-binding Zn ribbon-like protein|nr:CGNR zinc finger domain-containing protein [Candidatus Limnocylindrales bacterium]
MDRQPGNHARRPPASDLARAIEVVNSWDTLDAEPEHIDGIEIFRRFLRWADEPLAAEAVGEDDLVAFRTLRARLRAVFDAASETDAVAAVSALLSDAPVVVAVDGEAGHWQIRHRAAGSGPLDSLRVRCAIALLEAIRDGGWATFGICAGDPCTCVYVDRTRNHSRRYCSELCNNRVSQLAHRRRRSAAQ